MTCFYFYISDSGGSIKTAANLFDELPEVLQGINSLHNSSLVTAILPVYLVLVWFSNSLRDLTWSADYRNKWAVASLVQSLNSPFFPPHIGAEPRRAKRESRITCMRMLRIPPFFPPNREKNHIWKHVSDSACSVIFWIIIYIYTTIFSFWLVKKYFS